MAASDESKAPARRARPSQAKPAAEKRKRGPKPETPSGPQRLNAAERAERAAQIVALRRQNVPFDEIAPHFEISHQRAYQIYQKALADRPNLQVDEHRAEEADVIDKASRELLVLALSPTTTDRIKVDAWNALKGWREHKAKVFGLNAPQKHEVHTLDQLDRELAALDAELAATGIIESSPPAALETSSDQG